MFKVTKDGLIKLALFEKPQGFTQFEAPELAYGCAGFEQADIWAVGCLLFWLVERQEPFDSVELWRKAKKREMACTEHEFVGVIAKCLQKVP